MIPEAITAAVITEMTSGFNEADEYFSRTRDVFTARIQSYVLETKKYLEAAVIGEIGNNTFDHNLIFDKGFQWGVYCNLLYNQQNNWHLYFQSGFGVCSIDGHETKFFGKTTSITGCLAILDLSGEK